MNKILYCFDKDLPFDYSKAEIAIAKKQEIGILYDSKLKKFTDFLENEVDITGKTLFPRTGSTQIFKMNEMIIKRGAVPVVSNEEINKVENWTKYYKTKRKIKVYKGKELIEKIEEIEKEFGKNIFIKTVKKNFSDVISVSLLKDKECIFYKTLEYHLEDEFVVSEPVNIISDKYGLKEYRCFVINNEAYNISRYTTEVFHQIDSKVLEKLNDIINSVKGIFPSSYVVDLMEYKIEQNKFIDVVEFNPIHGSGLYLYNSVLEKREDILNKNIKKVAKEFMLNIDSCSIDGKVINERRNLYNIKGFSNDLMCMYITGEIGLSIASDVNIAPKDYAMKAEKVEFKEFKDNRHLNGSRSNTTDISLDINEDLAKEKLAKMKKMLS